MLQISKQTMYKSDHEVYMHLAFLEGLDTKKWISKEK